MVGRLLQWLRTTWNTCLRSSSSNRYVMFICQESTCHESGTGRKAESNSRIAHCGPNQAPMSSRLAMVAETPTRRSDAMGQVRVSGLCACSFIRAITASSVGPRLSSASRWISSTRTRQTRARTLCAERRNRVKASHFSGVATMRSARSAAASWSASASPVSSQIWISLPASFCRQSSSRSAVSALSGAMYTAAAREPRASAHHASLDHSRARHISSTAVLPDPVGADSTRCWSLQ
mmetsp:Transcript_18629/g.59573  ORF Transcript_18629/g.59573 Transcript_18629/m.59573 type:complete len:236 (-) Transcript_18629:132-839(-)